MHLAGPTGLPFNFADGHAKKSTPSPAQSWLASHFKDAPQARYVRDMFSRALEKGRIPPAFRTSPLTILWLPDAPPAGRTAAKRRGVPWRAIRGPLPQRMGSGRRMARHQGRHAGRQPRPHGRRFVLL